MLLKIQFSASKLAEMLVARLKAQDLCFDPIDDHTFVDHIEFPATAKIHGGPDRTVWIPVTEHGTTRDATGPTVQVVIPLTIFKAGLADVRAAAPNPPPTEPIGGLEAVLGLDISTDASWLIVTFVKLQIVGGATTPQLDSLNAQLVKKVGRQLVPFIDVQGSLRAMGSQGQTVVWAGIATNRAESIVEVRLEYQTMRWTGDMLDWASFYAGDFFDLVGTDDWAFFLDRNLIVDSVGRIFSAALATDPSHFAPRSPVHVTWYVDPVNPEVEIFVVFSGLAISACNCFFTDIDVSVDVKATITFGVSADELTLDITFDYSSDPLAAFCCELSAGLFFPFVGTKYLLSGKLDEADYILGMIGWVLGAMVPDTIGAIIAESSRKAPIPSPGGPCTKASDSLITCSYPLPPDEAGDSCNEWLPTKRTATAVRGDDHGVVVAGSVDVAQVEPATLSVAVSPFEWGGLDVNCSGAVGTLTQPHS